MLLRFLRIVALALSAALAILSIVSAIEVTSFDVAALERSVPRETALMIERGDEARSEHRAFRVDQRWIPYPRISPLLRRAVLVAEDDAFFTHGGLDWNEIRASARRDLEAHRVVRGGSTITQQLAKNLYLSSERSLTRKLKEVFLAFRLERALSKRRIFELYLNEIEWGDGVFGAEAAAERWFGVPASALNARQAALLAAVIVNPRRYSPLDPAPRIERRVRMIASRLHRRGALDDAQYRLAIGEGPPPPESLWVWLRGGGQDSRGDGTSEPAAPGTADSTSAPPDSTS
ncbi:MAG: monofunctional biosynthetic peptidoglycan transglycosylase [Candidatus Eisenbacteria bacterium]|nr:monofunctional biosynthetic peptidoglycan transglycosylase [Candidatus Eisenbacteria bacterium]